VRCLFLIVILWFLSILLRLHFVVESCRRLCGTASSSSVSQRCVLFADGDAVRFFNRVFVILDAILCPGDVCRSLHLLLTQQQSTLLLC
jgi:hypothetical protein